MLGLIYQHFTLPKNERVNIPTKRFSNNIVIGAVYLFSSKTKRNSFNSFDKKIWLWIILIAVLTAGYRYTQIRAIKIAPVSLVLSVKRISVFIAVIIGGKLFNEKNLLKKTLATAIMVAGAIMIMEEG